MKLWLQFLLVSFGQHMALLPQSLPLYTWSRGLFITTCALA